MSFVTCVNLAIARCLTGRAVQRWPSEPGCHSRTTGRWTSSPCLPLITCLWLY
ncbi:Hypothetical predicted protein [Scomber scombrus]|uniref:Uncharacterized protein n=1 Tax=Scomber scombrus TaxID=13677 RepID=A0AAV1NS98_SCOSC